MSFESLGLRAELLRALADSGYVTPTPVQAQAIPPILDGRDMLAGAQTGTGKTAGFTLPILQRLSANAEPVKAWKPAPKPEANAVRTKTPWMQHSAPAKPVRALILVPTRELAAQVQESVRTYGAHLRLSSSTVFGGVKMNPQIDMLRRGVDILVATPGRLLDHISHRNVDLSKVEILVLDEADRMLDMGFILDIKRIMAQLPKTRQTLMFSATFTTEIRQLADRMLLDPVSVQVARQSAESELVSQSAYHTARESKRDLLVHLIESMNMEQALVFTRTKHGADRLADQLEKDGISAVRIHGNRSQPQRTKALASFKRGEARILVATDIAARGIDIDQLPFVINYELPNVPEDYVHRIGRTGRAGSTGEAISLVSVDERHFLSDIERLMNKRIERREEVGYAVRTRDAQTEGMSEREERQPRQSLRPKVAPAPPRRVNQAPKPRPKKFFVQAR